MASNFNAWKREILAIVRKEFLSEIRTLSGFLTTALFAFISVVIVGTATYAMTLSPVLAAGLLWIILVFAGSVTLPRVFIAEEEQGTADLLRLIARPEAVFWGKVLVNMAQMILTSFFVTVFMVINSHIKVVSVAGLAVNLVAGSLSIAATVTLCGALAAQATNRATVAVVTSVPLLVFLVNLGVTAVSICFGEANRDGLSAVFGMIGYTVLVCTVGPTVYGMMCKR